MTVLDCIRVCATHMQRKFMGGVPYGTVGVPNMQSILELSALSDADATAAIASDPELAAQAREVGLLA